MRDLARSVALPVLAGACIGLVVIAAWLWQQSGVREDRRGYAAAVARAAPSVVNIYSRSRIRPALCADPRLAPWCDRLSSQDRTSLGSGVIVHPDGYIVTNAHVIDRADEILVMLADGRTSLASLVGSDRGTDIAVIRVPLTGLRAITLGNAGDMAVGDVVLAIGNPFGIGQTVSLGIISAKGRASISASPYDDFLQTDAAINPGNSGGALIDSSGALIGINTLILTGSGETPVQAMGVGFAIPANLAYDVLEELIETGRITRGWLGVTLDDVPPVIGEHGLRIVAVDEAGPAARAGIRPGDLVLSVNGRPAQDPNDFSRAIGRTRPGQDVELTIARNGELKDLTVAVGARGDL